MKVKMNVQTVFSYNVLKPGDEIDVADKVGARWVKNGIAVAVEGKAKSPEEMTAKELYKLCKDKGLEVAEKQSKEVYLEALGLLPTAE